MDIVRGRVTGYKDVSTVGERALMLAVARQPVSTAIEADQSSFQSYKSGVLCSRGTVPSVEVRLVRASAAKPAEFVGEYRTLTTQSPSTLTGCFGCTLHLFSALGTDLSCTPGHTSNGVTLA